MTDRDNDDIPATDLSAIDPHRDPLLADRVIGRAMAQIGRHANGGERSRSSTGMLVDVARWWYPGLAAAAIILVTAGMAVVRTTPAPTAALSDDAVESQVLDWVRSGHIPSNGDLLSTFRVSTP